jgi:PPK2 family polyphosphate:nucleotide phosphotransferase
MAKPPYRIDSGERVNLAKLDPRDDGGWERDAAEARAEELGRELEDLQELQYAAGDHGLLIVLQGRDTAGKDGTIRYLLQHMNAQGTRIQPFKVPTPKELSHDFLWRVHAVTPGRSETVIFNRSHYEDVLVVRVHNLVPESIWKERYEMINDFERLLVKSNTIVAKFMLHISKEEQEERLLEREQETEKAWKLSVGDWKEREYWDAYTEAYEAALERCSEVPWHVIPADKKWYRNLAITETLVEILRPYREGWMEKLGKVGERAKAELAEYRAEVPL